MCHFLKKSWGPVDDNLAPVVNTMDLKYVLREIETYGANIHGGWLLLLMEDDSHNIGT